LKFTSATQLKDWIKNTAKRTGAPVNVLQKTYFMERLLERISVSLYSDKMILKGGFLIASMIGINKRSTMDMDATAIGLPLSYDKINEIMSEIIAIDVNDDVYILLSLNRETISRDELLFALHTKAKERGSIAFIDNYAHHLKDISLSPEITNTWNVYTKDFSYANDINLDDVLKLISWVFEG